MPKRPREAGPFSFGLATIDLVLRRLAINLLCFGQDRDPVSTTEFSPLSVDLYATCHTERAQQKIRVEIAKARAGGQPQKQEQNTHKMPNSWNTTIKTVRNQHRELPSGTESSQIMRMPLFKVPYIAHKFALCTVPGRRPIQIHRT